jgi:hypothetical protein
MVERAFCFHWKKKMALALAPMQTGVAIAGGAAMGVHMMEAMMRLDPSKGELNVDIQNMFNTLCRVSLLEDVITSEADLGIDFTEMLKYLTDMTYGHESSLWFKIDASIDAETGEIQEERWAELKSRLGVHQGRPLSCFLAALGLAKCLNAAQAAIDSFNEVERFNEGWTDEQKAKGWELAEAMGAVSSYLDDASFVAAAAALCTAYDAYTAVAAKRGWKCVQSKSVLAYGFYGGQAHPHFDCAGRVEGGIARTAGLT